MGNSQEAFESERESELRKALSLLGIHPQETRVSLQFALTCHAPLHVWINFQPFTPVLSLVWNSAKNSCKVKVFFQQASFPLGCLHAFDHSHFFLYVDIFAFTHFL